MEERLKKFGKFMRRVSLSDEEKLSLREVLAFKMAGKEQVTGRKKSSFFTQFLFFQTQSFRVVVASFLLVAVLGSSVVFAAEGSLPGDILYPVKINVGENIARVLKGSGAAKVAEFETSLLDKRLSEAETLDQEKKLSGPLGLQVKKGVLKQKAKAEQEAGVIAQQSGDSKLPSGAIVRPTNALSGQETGTEPKELRNMQNVQEISQFQGVSEIGDSGDGKERDLKNVLQKHQRILNELDLEDYTENQQD